MIDHARFERGVSLWARGAVSPDSEAGVCYVRSDADPTKRYLVATPWARGGMRCTCPDWQARRVACKHILAAALFEAEKHINRYLAEGGDLETLKAQAIMAGLMGPETPGKDVIWTASYEMIRLLEEGEL